MNSDGGVTLPIKAERARVFLYMWKKGLNLACNSAAPGAKRQAAKLTIIAQPFY